MTRKLALLKRVEAARRRLRDAAAAEVATAAAELYDRERALIDATRARDAAVDDTARRLRDVSRIGHIEALAGVLADVKIRVARSEHDVRAAASTTSRANEALRARERKLRTATKLVDRATDDWQRSTDRAEQRAADDITGARHRRIA